MANWFTNLFTTPNTNRIGGAKKHWNCRGSNNYIAHSGQVFGDNTRLGIKLVYDSLQRRNQTKKLSKGAVYFDWKDLKYAEFESNVLWLLGVIIDTENSVWDPKLKGKSSTTKAYGYYQVINKDFIKTANNRLKNQIKAYNDYSNRVWSKEDHLFSKSELIKPLWIRDLDKDISNPDISHYDIVDKYHADIFGCLVLITMLIAGKDKDWLNLLHNRVESGKLLYYRGHHADKKYIAMSDSDLLSPIGGVDLAVWHNVSKNIKCNKPHAISFKTSQNAQSYSPNNTCNVSGDSKTLQQIADIMIDNLTILNAKDYAIDRIDNFSRANNVTAEFPNVKPTDIVIHNYPHNFKIGEVWRSERGTSEHAYYLFDMVPNNKNISIKDLIKDIIKSEVKRKSNPDELLKSVTKTFGALNGHKAYHLGVMIRVEEKPIWFPTYLTRTSDVPNNITEPVEWDIGLLNGNVQVMMDEKHTVDELNANKKLPSASHIIRYYAKDYDLVKAELLKPNPIIKFKISGTWELTNELGFFSSKSNLDPLVKGLDHFYNNLPHDTFSDELKGGQKSKQLLAGFWNSKTDATNMTMYTADDYTQTLIHEIGSHRWLDAKGGHGEHVMMNKADIKHTKAVLSNPYVAYNAQAAIYKKGIASGWTVSGPEETAAYNELKEIESIIERDVISKNFIQVSGYKHASFEDEWIARLVGTMSIYKCITYEHDIYPKLKKLGLNHSLKLQREFDQFIRDEFLLTERQYGEIKKPAVTPPEKVIVDINEETEGLVVEDLGSDIIQVQRTTDQMAHMYLIACYVPMNSIEAALAVRGSFIDEMLNNPLYGGDNNMTIARISKAIATTAKQKGLVIDASEELLEMERTSFSWTVLSDTTMFVRSKINPATDEWGWFGWDGGLFGVYKKK